MSQDDHVPADNLRPTSGWRPGEVVSDPVQLSLPLDLPPGEYRINVGVYDPDSGERLPLTIEGERLQYDQLPLLVVTLPQ